jgi:hypothetical protein
MLPQRFRACERVGVSKALPKIMSVCHAMQRILKAHSDGRFPSFPRRRESRLDPGSERLSRAKIGRKCCRSCRGGSERLNQGASRSATAMSGGDFETHRVRGDGEIQQIGQKIGNWYNRHFST